MAEEISPKKLTKKELEELFNSGKVSPAQMAQSLGASKSSQKEKPSLLSKAWKIPGLTGIPYVGPMVTGALAGKELWDPAKWIPPKDVTDDELQELFESGKVSPAKLMQRLRLGEPMRVATKGGAWRAPAEMTYQVWPKIEEMAKMPLRAAKAIKENPWQSIKMGAKGVFWDMPIGLVKGTLMSWPQAVKDIKSGRAIEHPLRTAADIVQPLIIAGGMALGGLKVAGMIRPAVAVKIGGALKVIDFAQDTLLDIPGGVMGRTVGFGTRAGGKYARNILGKHVWDGKKFVNMDNLRNYESHRFNEICDMYGLNPRTVQIDPNRATIGPEGLRQRIKLIHPNLTDPDVDMVVNNLMNVHRDLTKGLTTLRQAKVIGGKYIPAVEQTQRIQSEIITDDIAKGVRNIAPGMDDIQVAEFARGFAKGGIRGEGSLVREARRSPNIDKFAKGIFYDVGKNPKLIKHDGVYFLTTEYVASGKGLDKGNRTNLHIFNGEKWAFETQFSSLRRISKAKLDKVIESSKDRMTSLEDFYRQAKGEEGDIGVRDETVTEPPQGQPPPTTPVAPTPTQAPPVAPETQRKVAKILQGEEPVAKPTKPQPVTPREELLQKARTAKNSKKFGESIFEDEVEYNPTVITYKGIDFLTTKSTTGGINFTGLHIFTEDGWKFAEFYKTFRKISRANLDKVLKKYKGQFTSLERFYQKAKGGSEYKPKPEYVVDLMGFGFDMKPKDWQAQIRRVIKKAKGIENLETRDAFLRLADEELQKYAKGKNNTDAIRQERARIKGETKPVKIAGMGRGGVETEIKPKAQKGVEQALRGKGSAKPATEITETQAVKITKDNYQEIREGYGGAYGMEAEAIRKKLPRVTSENISVGSLLFDFKSDIWKVEKIDEVAGKNRYNTYHIRSLDPNRMNHEPEFRKFRANVNRVENKTFYKVLPTKPTETSVKPETKAPTITPREEIPTDLDSLREEFPEYELQESHPYINGKSTGPAEYSVSYGNRFLDSPFGTIEEARKAIEGHRAERAKDIKQLRKPLNVGSIGMFENAYPGYKLRIVPERATKLKQKGNVYVETPFRRRLFGKNMAEVMDNLEGYEKHRREFEAKYGQGVPEVKPLDTYQRSRSLKYLAESRNITDKKTYWTNGVIFVHNKPPAQFMKLGPKTEGLPSPETISKTLAPEKFPDRVVWLGEANSSHIDYTLGRTANDELIIIDRNYKNIADSKLVNTTRKEMEWYGDPKLGVQGRIDGKPVVSITGIVSEDLDYIKGLKTQIDDIARMGSENIAPQEAVNKVLADTERKIYTHQLKASPEKIKAEIEGLREAAEELRVQGVAPEEIGDAIEAGILTKLLKDERGSASLPFDPEKVGLSAASAMNTWRKIYRQGKRTIEIFDDIVGDDRISRTVREVNFRGDRDAGHAHIRLRDAGYFDLNRKEFRNMVDVRENDFYKRTGSARVKPLNESVAKVVRAWHAETENVHVEARNVKLDVGYIIGYWPHRANINPEASQRHFQKFIQGMVDSGKYDNTSEAIAEYQQFISSRRDRIDPHLELARKTNLPYAKTKDVGLQYLRDAYRRIWEVKLYGQKDARIKEILSEAPNLRDQQYALRVWDEMVGVKQLFGEEFRGAASFLRNINTLRYLGTSALPNSAQPLFAVAQGNIRAFMKTCKSMIDGQGKRFAEQCGISIESTLRELSSGTGVTGKAARGMLKYNQFSNVERVNRVFAANMGKFQAMELLGRLQGKPVIPFIGKLRRNTAKRWLKMMNIDSDDALRRGTLTEMELERAGDFMERITQHRYERPEIPPLAWRSPITQLAWQYKNFAYNHARYLYTFCLKEAAKGNPLPLVKALAYTGSAGWAVQNLRWKIRGQKPPDNKVDEALGAITAAGGLGMFSDGVAALEYDPLAYTFGPSAARLKTTGQALWWAATGRPDPLKREAIQTIPFFGPEVLLRRLGDEEYREARPFPSTIRKRIQGPPTYYPIPKAGGRKKAAPGYRSDDEKKKGKYSIPKRGRKKSSVPSYK